MKTETSIPWEPRRPTTWVDLLDGAQEPEDVLKIVKDFLAGWDPYELEALPAPCKPPAFFVRPEDVVEFAFALVQHHCGLGTGDEGVFRMANFFSHATRRIALLADRVSLPRARSEDVT